MENNNEEIVQTAEEPVPTADVQLPEVESTAAALLATTNDEPTTPVQNTEEEKPNETPNQEKNTETANDNQAESKTSSKNVSAKFSSRSGQQAAVKQDVRAYLEEKVFPVLTNGLEELLKAVDERNKKLEEEEEEEEKIPEINPLFFLARYLMRNAPHSSSNTSRASSHHSDEPKETKEENNQPNETPETQNEDSTNSQADDENKPTEM